MEIYTTFIDWKTQFFKMPVFLKWVYRINVISFKIPAGSFSRGRTLQVDFKIYVGKQGKKNLRKKNKWLGLRTTELEIYYVDLKWF